MKFPPAVDEGTTQPPGDDARNDTSVPASNDAGRLAGSKDKTTTGSAHSTQPPEDKNKNKTNESASKDMTGRQQPGLKTP